MRESVLLENPPIRSPVLSGFEGNDLLGKSRVVLRAWTAPIIIENGEPLSGGRIQPRVIPHHRLEKVLAVGLLKVFPPAPGFLRSSVKEGDEVKDRDVKEE